MKHDEFEQLIEVLVLWPRMGREWRSAAKQVSFYRPTQALNSESVSMEDSLVTGSCHKSPGVDSRPKRSKLPVIGVACRDEGDTASERDWRTGDAPADVNVDGESEGRGAGGGRFAAKDGDGKRGDFNCPSTPIVNGPSPLGP